MRSRRESRQETHSWGRKKTPFPFWELRFCSEKWCIKIPTNRTFPTNQVKTEYIFWPVSCRQCSDHSAWGKVSKQDPFFGGGSLNSWLKSSWPHQKRKSAINQTKQLEYKIRTWLALGGRAPIPTRSIPFQNLVNACTPSLLSVELLNLLNCEIYICTLSTHIYHASLWSWSN